MNRQRKFILIAAIAGLIALFLPWVTVSAGNFLDGPGAGDNGLGAGASNMAEGLFGKSAMSASENGMHGAGIMVFISFLCAIALSLLGEQTRALERTNWLVAMAAGTGALLFTIVLLANTQTGSLGFVKSSVGWGAWIALLASAGVLGAAWVYRNPGDTLKGNFDKLKNDLGFRAGPPSDQGNSVN